MKDLLSFTIRLVQVTAQRIVQDYHRCDVSVNRKLDGSLVTETDLIAGEYIHQKLAQSFPDDMIICEELSPSHQLLSEREKRTSRPTWIVDPLDGTTNFSLGLPFWGILITRLENDFPALTVMYFPILNELFTALKGQGAFRNQSRLKISYDPRDQRTFFACCSRTFRDYQVKIPYKVRILGSSAYSFCMVARNQAIVAFEATPKIWDLAGAWLLVSEAGGYIETLDFSQPFPLSLDLPYEQISFPVIAAATQNLIQEARYKIIPRFHRSQHHLETS